MFEILGVKPEDVLSGYLVPFRSPCWAALAQKAASIRFGMDAWQKILGKTKATTFIAFGKDIAPHMNALLKTVWYEEHPAGWGDQTIDVYKLNAGGRLVILPHLSRFGLFNRPVSENAFRFA